MKTTIIALTAVTALLLTSAVHADMMTYNGVGLNEIVQLHAAGTIADNYSVYAGQEKVAVGGVDYTVYCVDINHWSASGEVTPTPANQLLPRANDVAYLMSTYAPTVTTNHQAAVLGVALWELVNETAPTLDATTGYFSISGNDPVAADANALLASIPTNYVATSYPTVLFGRDTVQSFVIESLPGNAVPEPATMVLLILGAAGLVVKKHRRVA